LPKIQFADLPRAVWHHILERVDERRISMSDLQELQTTMREMIKSSFDVNGCKLFVLALAACFELSTLTLKFGLSGVRL